MPGVYGVVHSCYHVQDVQGTNSNHVHLVTLDFFIDIPLGLFSNERLLISSYSWY